jgi:hypothetical protein
MQLGKPLDPQTCNHNISHIKRLLERSNIQDAYDMAMTSADAIESLTYHKIDKDSGDVIDPVLPLQKFQQGSLKVI